MLRTSSLTKGTLQAVLDGLDILLAQKVHARRCKFQVLDLRNTGWNFWRMIMDSHLTAILPALSHCSQLRVINMCGNLISMAILESLLRHTERLPDLSLELYPAPRESYSTLGILHQERLAQLQAELWEILTDLGCPRKI
ncbi:PRAME family member 8-like [Dama dama]